MGTLTGNVLICFQVKQVAVSLVKDKMIQLGYSDFIQSGNDIAKLPECALVKPNISTDIAMEDLKMVCISNRLTLQNAISVLTKDGGGNTDGNEDISVNPAIARLSSSSTPTRFNRGDRSRSGRPYGGDYYEENSWNCDVCGGSDATGCLYHDPTECPRSDGD
jgi:hypothetical protein